MAKAFYQQPVWQRNDAEFRDWGGSFSAALASVGLVQTADTGQINWSTVTRAAASTAAGYEIWRFNDSAQSAFPIFIKIEYGSRSSNLVPCVWITVGTGSNGSGTITGIFCTRHEATGNGSIVGDGLARTTAISHVDGFLCFELAYGAINWLGSTSIAFMALSRTVDDTGSPTGDGVLFLGGQPGAKIATAYDSARNAYNHVVSTSTAIAMIPPGITSSSTPDGTQVFAHAFAIPKMHPSPFTVSVFSDAVGAFTEFEATPFGSTERSFLRLSDSPNVRGMSASGQDGAFLAMIWED